MGVKLTHFDPDSRCWTTGPGICNGETFLNLCIFRLQCLDNRKLRGCAETPGVQIRYLLESSELNPTRQHYTVILPKLPIELLYCICGFLQKEGILNLCLVCRGTNFIFTEALFVCLVFDQIPPFYRGVRSQRLDIVARLVEKYHVNIDPEYAGKIVLLLAIELRYPQAVDMILRYKPNVRYCCDFGGRGALSLAVIGRNTAIFERVLQLQEIDINDRCSDGMSAIYKQETGMLFQFKSPSLRHILCRKEILRLVNAERQQVRF